jgi:hypothetical protein
MAEGVGFEPTDPCGSPVFKTGALNRSAIPPILYWRLFAGNTITPVIYLIDKTLRTFTNSCK